MFSTGFDGWTTATSASRAKRYPSNSSPPRTAAARSSGFSSRVITPAPHRAANNALTASRDVPTRTSMFAWG